MPAFINIGQQSIPVPQTTRPTITVDGNSSPVPADKIGPFPIEPKQAPSDNTIIQTGVDNSIEAPFIDIEKVSSELQQSSTDTAAAPQADSGQFKLRSLNEQRLDVQQEQTELQEQNQSIEREIQILEKVERSLDRRISQLKQIQTLGQRLDVSV